MEYDLCQSDLKDFSLLPEYEIHIFKGTLFVFAGVQFHLLVAGMLTRPLVDGYGACTKAPALHNHRNHDGPNQQNDVAKTRKKSVAFSVLVDFEDLATDFGREPSKIEKRSAVANAASKTTHEVKNMNENIENECGLKSKMKNKCNRGKSGYKREQNKQIHPSNRPCIRSSFRWSFPPLSIL